MKSTRIEVLVKCNDGTKYKVMYDRKNQDYVLYYRNDTKPLSSSIGDKVKGKWLYLAIQNNYSDILDYMFDEVKSIDAVNGD